MDIEDPGDGNTADENIRQSSHDLAGQHAGLTPEHQGNGISFAHPSDDDGFVKEGSDQPPSFRSVQETMGCIMFRHIEKNRKKRLPPPKIPGEFAPPDTDDRVQIGNHNINHKRNGKIIYA